MSPPATILAKGRPAKSFEKFFSKGVDGRKNDCIVGGSLETKCPCGAGLKALPRIRSLTVCAGDLCGRLGVDNTSIESRASSSLNRVKSILNLSNQSSLVSLSKVTNLDAQASSNFN
jgi:hypothetical protein